MANDSSAQWQFQIPWFRQYPSVARANLMLSRVGGPTLETVDDMFSWNKLWLYHVFQLGPGRYVCFWPWSCTTVDIGWSKTQFRLWCLPQIWLQSLQNTYPCSIFSTIILYASYFLSTSTIKAKHLLRLNMLLDWPTSCATEGRSKWRHGLACLGPKHQKQSSCFQMMGSSNASTGLDWGQWWYTSQ